MAVIILIFVNLLVHFTTATVLLIPQTMYNGQQTDPGQLPTLLLKPVFPLSQAAASLLTVPLTTALAAAPALTAPLGAVHRAAELVSAQAVPASQAVLNAASTLPHTAVKAASPLLSPIAGQLPSIPPVTSVMPSSPSAGVQVPLSPATSAGIPIPSTPTLTSQQPAVPSFPPKVGGQSLPTVGGKSPSNSALPVLPLPSSPSANLPVASGVLPPNALLPNLLDLPRSNNPSTQLFGGSPVSTGSQSEGITLRP